MASGRVTALGDTAREFKSLLQVALWISKLWLVILNEHLHDRQLASMSVHKDMSLSGDDHNCSWTPPPAVAHQPQRLHT